MGEKQKAHPPLHDQLLFHVRKLEVFSKPSKPISGIDVTAATARYVCAVDAQARTRAKRAARGACGAVERLVSLTALVLRLSLSMINPRLLLLVFRHRKHSRAAASLRGLLVLNHGSATGSRTRRT